MSNARQPVSRGSAISCGAGQVHRDFLELVGQGARLNLRTNRKCAEGCLCRNQLICNIFYLFRLRTTAFAYGGFGDVELAGQGSALLPCEEAALDLRPLLFCQRRFTAHCYPMVILFVTEGLTA